MEKIIDYYGGGKANFEIVDEISALSDYPQRCFSTILLKLNGEENQNYLIEYEDNFKEMITQIHNIWKIDLEQEKFVAIEVPKNLICHNPDYLE